MVADVLRDSAAPISLYLQVERGKSADLEVVARASLALAAAIKEVAFRLDPSVEVRVELISGTEGSLFLNSIIRTLRDKAKERPIAAMIAATVLGWFGSYTFNELLDELRDARVEITDEQIEEIARRSAEYGARGEGQPQAAEIYRELSQDPAIEAAGAALRPDKKPRHVVPRSEFPDKIRKAEFALVPVEETPKRRTRQRRLTLIIVSMVLEHGQRRWKLRSFEGEYGYVIRDKQFLDDLLTGKRIVPTVEGVQMDALIETSDVWTGLAWKPVENVVVQVFDIVLPQVQTELMLTPPKKQEKRRRKKTRPNSQ